MAKLNHSSLIDSDSSLHLAAGGGVFSASLITHYANHSMQYMVGLKLREMVPGLQLSNFELPYWDINIPPLYDDEISSVIVGAKQHVDLPKFAYLLNNKIVRRINWLGYGQRMQNFPDKEPLKRHFARFDTEGLSLGDDYLVCPIRAGEILDGGHSGYPLIPAEFYREMANKYGKKLVFMGQTDPNCYMDALRAALPDALFLSRKGPLVDFQIIRQARNIVVPVSTFAWLAAWLSNAALIVLPVFGLYNPRQFPEHDLLPLAEPHYQFYEFPPHSAVPLELVLEDHADLSGQWRHVAPQELIHFLCG